METFSVMGPNWDLFSSYKKWLYWSNMSCFLSILLVTDNCISNTKPLLRLALIMMSRVPWPSLSLIRTILNISLSLFFSSKFCTIHMIYYSLEWHLHRSKSNSLKVTRLRLSRSFLAWAWKAYTSIPTLVSSTSRGIFNRKWMSSFSCEQR